MYKWLSHCSVLEHNKMVTEIVSWVKIAHWFTCGQSKNPCRSIFESYLNVIRITPLGRLPVCHLILKFFYDDIPCMYNIQRKSRHFEEIVFLTSVWHLLDQAGRFPAPHTNIFLRSANLASKKQQQKKSSDNDNNNNSINSRGVSNKRLSFAQFMLNQLLKLRCDLRSLMRRHSLARSQAPDVAQSAPLWTRTVQAFGGASACKLSPSSRLCSKIPPALKLAESNQAKVNARPVFALFLEGFVYVCLLPTDFR